MCVDRSFMRLAKATGIGFCAGRTSIKLRLLERGMPLSDSDKDAFRHTAKILDEVDTITFAARRLSIEEIWRRRRELEIDYDDSEVLKVVGERFRRMTENDGFKIDLPACAAELRDIADGRTFAQDARVPLDRLIALCRTASDVGAELAHPPGCF